MLEDLNTVNEKCSFFDPIVLSKTRMGTHESGKDFVFRYFDPFADQVFVVGSFNGWSHSHPMQRSPKGVWTASIAQKDSLAGSKYKYMVLCDGEQRYVTDPYGDATDGAPYHNSVICKAKGCIWNDGSYPDPDDSMYGNGFDGQPLHVYEIGLDGWCTDRQATETYKHAATELSVYARQMGYTHVLVNDVFVRRCDWDRGAHTVEYYAPNERFGDADAFRCFVDVMHRARIGVIVDWNFDNGQDIYSKYGVSSDVVLHWMHIYHIDGVALTVKDQNGACLACELSREMRAVKRDAAVIVRGCGARMAQSGDCIVYDELCGERLLSVFARGSDKTDELQSALAIGKGNIVGFGKERYIGLLPGDEWRMFARARAAFCSLMTLGGKKHTYMGCEIGMTDAGRVDWTVLDGAYNAGLQLCCSDIGEIYLAHPSLWRNIGVEVLDDSHLNDGVVLFERCHGNERILVLVNASVNAYENRAFFVGERGTYDEIFNSDSECYCGSGVTNKKTMRTVSVEGRAVLTSVQVPPLAVAVFKERPK